MKQNPKYVIAYQAKLNLANPDIIITKLCQVIDYEPLTNQYLLKEPDSGFLFFHRADLCREAEADEIKQGRKPVN